MERGTRGRWSRKGGKGKKKELKEKVETELLKMGRRTVSGNREKWQQKKMKKDVLGLGK